MTRLIPLTIAVLAMAASLCPEPGRAATGAALSPNVTVDSRDFPEIAVENAAGASLLSGASADQPFASVVGVAVTRTFTIRNLGAGGLAGIAVTLQGASAPSFTVTLSPASTVSPAGSTQFTVRFLPTSAGLKTASLLLANNDPDENPFGMSFTGRVLSLVEDGDGDGLSDASEFQMAALGFDWQTAQPALVNTYLSNANGAGLYTAAQIQALRVGAPLLSRDALTGRFKLTIGLKNSPSPLQPFVTLPFDAPQATTVINAQGELEFEFTVPDAAAFFQVEAR